MEVGLVNSRTKYVYADPGAPVYLVYERCGVTIRTVYTEKCWFKKVVNMARYTLIIFVSRGLK